MAQQKENEMTNEIEEDDDSSQFHKKLSEYEDLKLSKQNITIESLAQQTKLKKTIDKIQAIAMLQSFKKVIR